MKKVFLFLAALLTATVMNLNAETATNVKYIDASGKEQTCASATVVADASSKVTWNAGWYVVTGTNVTLSKGAVCKGAVHLILADGAKLTTNGAIGSAGIDVNGKYSLTIYGQAGQTGQLIATGNAGGAGIGGSNSAGSNITINGGNVTATGDGGGAGIGGGQEGSGSNITINGGTVTATGSGGAGIGGGAEGAGSYITINGGTVTATSISNAGIGSGDMGDAASNIFVNPASILKADNNNPPTTEIAHATIKTDVASLLADKQYVTVETPAGPTKNEKFSVEGNNFVVIGTDPMEVMVDTNSLASGAVVIPDSVVYKDTKLAVTAIASNAFKNNANITSVVVPGTIDTISKYAFYNCASLKVVKLNEGVKFLRETSFNRTHLDSIFFPASLTKFTGDLSKQMETDVKWFEVAAGNTEASSVDGVLFNANANVLLYFPIASERSEYAVPAGVDTIAQYAASMDTNLVSVKMPDVVMVGEGAFSDCGKLASVEFSDAIDSIGSYAFFSDTVLTAITCPAVVPPALGEMVFYGIDLSKITLYVPAESVTTYEAADTWKDMNIQSKPKSGIQNVNVNVNVNANRKEMRKGQLLIIRDDKTYNAQGAAVK